MEWSRGWVRVGIKVTVYLPRIFTNKHESVIVAFAALRVPSWLIHGAKRLVEIEGRTDEGRTHQIECYLPRIFMNKHESVNVPSRYFVFLRG
jgi:hypothetical protein